MIQHHNLCADGVFNMFVKYFLFEMPFEDYNQEIRAVQKHQIESGLRSPTISLAVCEIISMKSEREFFCTASGKHNLLLQSGKYLNMNEKYFNFEHELI